MSTWRIVPTTRRTSAPGCVDILDGERMVAHAVQRADALRMIHDPVQIAEDAINLYLEGLDRRDDDHEAARAYAMEEIIDAVNTDLDGLCDEMAAEEAWARKYLPPPDTLDDISDLPF